jgi:hypothetical protein
MCLLRRGYSSSLRLSCPANKWGYSTAQSSAEQRAKWLAANSDSLGSMSAEKTVQRMWVAMKDVPTAVMKDHWLVEVKATL